ncbi:MAG: guanylate kinase [Phycisphaerae bacterium]|nr:guanylate kinase [Phycisphaerae bacterium]
MDNSPGKLFVISGPSGSGKSTLTTMAVKQTGACLSISATTRGQSDSEIDGKDYFFITREQFESKISSTGFLEYAEVFGNYYGTPAAPVKKMLAEGKTVVLEIDVQGAMQVFENFPQAHGILILPPDDQELRRRLEARGRDKQEIIEQRLQKAKWEIDKAQQSNLYKNIIVNDKLEDALAEIVSILSYTNQC